MITERKIFCISMQRSGTTSVGDWLEAHGLRRAGYPMSREHRWTHLWAEGDFESIFLSSPFQAAEILEDDPWWCPDFYRVLAYRFHHAKFILLERDPEAWFRSLCAHSAGRNPGPTDGHCRIYRREADLERLAQQGHDVSKFNLLDITQHAAHYQAAYQRHTRGVLQFFSNKPRRLLHGRLDDPTIFARMCEFVGVPLNPVLPIPRANAATPAMEQKLRTYLDGNPLRRIA